MKWLKFILVSKLLFFSYFKARIAPTQSSLSMEVSAVNPLRVVAFPKRASFASSASPATLFPNATIGQSVNMGNGIRKCPSVFPDQVRKNGVPGTANAIQPFTVF